MTRYKPPTQVNAIFYVTLYNVDFQVKLAGSLSEDGPEIEESWVWIDYPHADSQVNLVLAPGLLYDEICDSVPNEDIIKTFNKEYEEHYHGWGDYIYEREKDRRMNQEDS